MPTLHLIKSMSRSPSRLGLLLIPLVFACFALAQSAQAASPVPNEGDLIGNMAGEADAVAELGSDTVEAAMGQAANTPNKREIPINIRKPLQCAGGEVILHGNMVVTFTHQALGLVRPTSVELKGFTGVAASGNRKLEGKNLRAKNIDTKKLNGKGYGTFDLLFEVTGPGLPGGKSLRIEVTYHPNVYTFEEGKVQRLTPDNKPTVMCKRH